MFSSIKKGLKSVGTKLDQKSSSDKAVKAAKRRIKMSLPKSPSGRKSVAPQDNIVNKAVTAIRNHFRPTGGV